MTNIGVEEEARWRGTVTGRGCGLRLPSRLEDGAEQGEEA
jgi:hypothetical protein